MHGLKFAALTAALAIPCFMTGQVHARSQITLFGVVDDGVVHTYQKKNDKGKKTVKNVTELRSGVYRGARWGIKGTEDLGNGYSVGFMLDSGFRDDDGGQTMNRLFGRESTLNVMGPCGELYLGRIGAITSAAGPMAVAAWYTPFGSSCGQFAVTSLSYMFNFQRVDNSVSYRSPKIGDARFLLQYSRDVDALEDIDPDTAGVQHGEEGKRTTGHYYATGFQFNNGKLDFNLGADHLTYAKKTTGEKPKSSYSVTFGGSVKYDRLKIYGGAQVFWHGTSAWLFTYNKLWAKTYLNGFAVVGGAEYKILGGLAMIAAGFNKTRSASSYPYSKSTLSGLSLGYAYPFTKRTNIYFLVNSAYATQKYDGQKKSRAFVTEEAIGLTHFF
ncbi:porin [Parasutterella excrementihominis]